MGKFIDLTGKRFGRLLVIKPTKKRAWDSVLWECLCDCGKEKIINGSYLKDGTKSCGCLHKDVFTTHGLSYTRFYKIHAGILQRCLNPKNPGYNNYGGRGITVCDRWLKFENFWEDMKIGYAENLMIERIDNDKGYYKENCKWITFKEQMNNTRQVRSITYNGITRNVTQWAESVGLTRDVFRSRIDKYGWSIEKALTTPKLK